MSRTHDIDNGEPFFEFDPYEQLKSSPFLEDASRSSRTHPAPPGSSPVSTTSSCSRTSLHDTFPPQSSMHQPNPKGKGVAASDPVPILPRAEYDPFFVLSSQSPGSSSRTADPMLDYFTSPTSDFITSEMVEMLVGEEPIIGKGKARELPPSLPPLSFSPSSLLYGSPESSALPGPSSYDSTFSSIQEVERSPLSPSSVNTEDPASPPNTPNRVEDAPHIPLRTRSLSNLSERSHRSLPGLSSTKVKFKLGNSSKAHSTIAKRLLFKKSQSPPNSPLSTPFQLDDRSEPAFETNFTQYGCVGQAGCLSPWVRDFRSRTPVATPVVETDLAWGAIHAYRAPRVTDSNPLRTKGRSYSSPLPLQTSVFDIVPLAPADIFAPIPTPIVVTNYFDEYLPHELKLHIFIALVFIHQAEHEKRLRDGKWTALKAASSRNKWVGRDRGIRELFKLTRVSKAWQGLVFDGQLWAKLELRSFPKLPSSILCRLSELAGGFIREIDFTGHANLPSLTLVDIADHLCAMPAVPTELPHTQLTSINLQGCSALTTRSLHYLLIRSPALRSLSVKGLPAVTNTTCDVLAVYCPQLVTLDMSRCPNMSGEGVRSVASTSVARGEHMMLKVLRLSGLKRVTDNMMEALGKAAPFLEVLDLSGARDLHNSGIEAFISCTEQEAPHLGEVIQLTSREAGRDPSDPTWHWRRVTKLRHLSLSGCILLTDHACSHLAHAVPKLEFLELAGIGPDLRDDGVVRLLETTPFIKKIDLEDASEISDDVLEALTPSQIAPSPTNATHAGGRTRTVIEPPEPGHALEHLILSYTNISSEALTDLIQSCTRLRVLEADNTRMTGLVLRDFVQHARKRETTDAKIVAIDCRGVGEHAVKDLTAHTRPRIGWRSWHARKLGFLDGRDEERLNVGQDECDANRVVVKTFYSWQTVDAVRAVRDKKRKSGSRRGMNGSNSSTTSEDVATSSGRARWWSPSGRRSGGPNTPTLLDMNDREGCTIM